MHNSTLYAINDITNNGFYSESLYIVSLSAIFMAISVIITKNPIVSVLFLIGLFVAIATYLILIGLNFIGISYLLVYVGAVSILFLFILMLINVRISELLSETRNSIPLVFIVSLIFNISMSYTMPQDQTYKVDNISYNLNRLGIFNNENIKSISNVEWDNSIVEMEHISAIGNIMYSSHSIWLLLVSFILLLAMVGAIVITINTKDYSKKLHTTIK